MASLNRSNVNKRSTSLLSFLNPKSNGFITLFYITILYCCCSYSCHGYVIMPSSKFAMLSSSSSSLSSSMLYRRNSVFCNNASKKSSSSSLYSTGGLFKRVFRRGGDDDKDDTTNSKKDNGENERSVPTTVIKIDAKNVKIGPLRFLLNIHLVGEQNNPTPKSWLCRQNDNNNNSIQVYYQDGSAMLEVVLNKNGIVLNRHGIRPSLQYQINESMLIHNILDELQTVAFGVPGDDDTNDKIMIDQRLLQLDDDTIIEKERSKLPVRMEK